MSDTPIKRARSMRKAMTPPELSLWLQLRSLRGWHFRRQSPEGAYILDFVCRRAKLVIEVDGVHHSSPEQSKHDARRDGWLRQQGFRVLRFWASDIEHELEGVMQAICATLGERPATSRMERSVAAIPPGMRQRRLVRLGLRRRR